MRVLSVKGVRGDWRIVGRGRQLSAKRSQSDASRKSGPIHETAHWRFHQHLGDIRNKCDHSKTDEPTVDEVKDLIDGVAKVIKTVFLPHVPGGTVR